jgi:hypothetical protein
MGWLRVVDSTSSWLAVAVLLSQRRHTQCRQLVGATSPILVSTVHSMLKVNNLIGLTLRAAVLEYYPIYLLYSTAQRRCDSLPGSILTGFARSIHFATLHWKYNLDRSRAFRECSSQVQICF